MDNGWNVFSRTPMWAGWNTQRYPKLTWKNVACYRQNIMEPPTRDDVVKETLKRLQVVLKECDDDYAIVIVTVIMSLLCIDLVVAKIAI